MPSRFTDLGITDMEDNHFGIAAVDVADAMSVSNFGTLLAGTTTIAAATFKDTNAFDATPTRSGLTVTSIASWTNAEITGQNITTIAIHNDGAGAYTGVQCGVWGLDMTLVDVDITVEMDTTGASA